MTDVINEVDFMDENAKKTSDEKMNNANSDTSNRSKKRSRSDTRKSHKSKAFLSRKNRSVQKIANTSDPKENQIADDRSSSENQNSSLPPRAKKELLLSDDQISTASDKRPIFLTRSKIRRIERRKAYSSNSSVVGSDHRKTKSEPIIITLDSSSEDSEDNVSVVSNRPNRTARIRGEIIRKLSRSASTKIMPFKSRDYSSSSDAESTKRKKKSKSVKTSSSSQAAKRKKYLVKRLACQSRLKLKSHKQRHAYRTPIARFAMCPIGERRELRSCHKKSEEHHKDKHSEELHKDKHSEEHHKGKHSEERHKDKHSEEHHKGKHSEEHHKGKHSEEHHKGKHSEEHDKDKLRKKSSSKKLSHQSPMERRTLRSTSTDANVDKILKNETDKDMNDNLENDVETKLQPEIIKTPQEVEEVTISKKETVEDTSVSPSVQNEEISNMNTNVEELLDVKVEPVLEEKIEPVSKEKIEPVHEEKIEPHTDANVESTINLNKELQNDFNVASIQNIDNEQTPNVELESQNATTTRETTEIASPEEEMKEVIKKAIPNALLPPKVKKMKKKIKPGEKILRKRGRPRLSDMKPVKNIPILNDMIQLPFLQKTFCFSEAPKLPKCRECRIAVNRSNRNMLHAYCRFMEYRKLCYSKTGCVLNAGFSEPSEATSEHLNQWLPQLGDPPKDLNCNTSKALLEHIGDQFCDLVEQEREALTLHIGNDNVITWKRIVQGVREMCDVCFTTLFNIHWVCPTCGLAVCIDCYKGRKQGITVEYEDGQPKNRDQYNWLLCSVRQPHDPEKLVMAQIIPGHALWTMRDLLHKARDIWNIPSYCKCNPQAVTSSDKYISTGICKQLMCFVTKSFSTERSNLYFNNESNAHNGESNYDDLDVEVDGTALKWVEGNIGIGDGKKSSEDFYNSYEDFASLRGSLLNAMNADDSTSENEREISSFSLDDIIECVTSSHNSEDKENSGKSVIKHFSNRYPQPNSGRDPLPIRIYSKLESNLAFMNVPHSWFCNGRLLFLLQSDHPDNLALFQEQWKRGQPILVKGVDERLSKDLWHPDAFCRDFGEVRNDLIDCRTGAIIKNLPMKRFWEGFESFAKRLRNDDNEYMLLKLKDWPPGEDFSEMLPRRFEDLMKGLPLPEYTHRDGILNLAGRLPSWFVRPDLGPKMYNAYGSALYPAKGTTNLHLDVSDAVNVMVYVGIPQDGNAQLHIEEALKAIDEGGCDSLMRARVRARGAKPGALWHIYNARDADKIREMLTKVAIERGEKLEAHHDPIHDQSWYLDAELRKRLYRDYGVEGYAIAQCLGDAVFIPAGAPHQVRNLHSCVKVAEDFVSPENIAHCFKLTQEFRHLSDTHTNHEDKLQIKNIIYHVVRDALAHLLADRDSLES